MPQLPSAESLRCHCVKFIAKDKKTKYEFHEIMPNLAMEILNEKLDLDNLKISEVKDLIKPGLKKINIEIPENELGLEIIKVIANTQQALNDLQPNLTNLALSPKSKISTRNPQYLLRGIMNYCETFLKNLKSFSLKLSKPIEALLNDDLDKERFIEVLRPCVNLEYINIDFQHSGFAKMALQTFKKLKIFNVPSSMPSVHACLRENFQLALNNLIYNSDRDQLQCLGINVNYVIKKKTFEIVKFKVREETDLSSLKNMPPCIKVLYICQDPNMYKFDTDGIIMQHGATLKDIHFGHVSKVFLSTIIGHCPNLQTLNLTDFEHIIQHSVADPLNNLTQLTIQPLNPGLSLSVNSWWCLLSQAKDLKMLELHRCDGIPLKKTLRDIYDIHHFPNLKIISVLGCVGLPLNSLLPIIEHSNNPLEWVDLTYEDDRAMNACLEYAERMTIFNFFIGIHNTM